MSSLRAQRQNDPYKKQHREQDKNAQNTMTQQSFRVSYCCDFRNKQTDKRESPQEAQPAQENSCLIKNSPPKC